MDTKDRSIVAQTCLKVSGEIYASLCDVSQGFQPDLLEAVFKKCWQLHSATMQAAVPAPPPPVEDDPGAPFGPVTQSPAAVQQPVPASPPVAQPSPPQPQQVMQGPPCPNCGTPTVMTKDYVAKKARNLSEGKKAPPMWKCPMGSYDWQTRTAQGCQGSIWEDAA